MTALVVSTGRCGSTLLTRVLHTHPDVLSLSEVFSTGPAGALPAGVLSGRQFWDLLERPGPLWSCLIRHGLEPDEVLFPFDGRTAHGRSTGVPPLLLVALPLLTDGWAELYEELTLVVPAFAPATVGGHYACLFDWLARRLGRRIWVERSGASLLWIDQLIDQFPGTRFIHLYRDGLSTGRSMSRHPVFRLMLVRERLTEWLGVDPFESDDRRRIDRVPENWRLLLPERFDPAALAAVDLPVRFFVMHWAMVESRGLDTLATLPTDSVLHVWYDRLQRQPRSELARIAAFLDLDPETAGWCDAAACLVRPPAPDQPNRPAEPVDRRLERLCQVAARRLAQAGLPI